MQELISSVATVYYTIVYIAVCCDKQCRRGFGLGSYARLRAQILLMGFGEKKARQIRLLREQAKTGKNKQNSLVIGFGWSR